MVVFQSFVTNKNNPAILPMSWYAPVGRVRGGSAADWWRASLIGMATPNGKQSRSLHVKPYRQQTKRNMRLIQVKERFIWKGYNRGCKQCNNLTAKLNSYTPKCSKHPNRLPLFVLIFFFFVIKLIKDSSRFLLIVLMEKCLLEDIYGSQNPKTTRNVQVSTHTNEQTAKMSLIRGLSSYWGRHFFFFALCGHISFYLEG